MNTSHFKNRFLTCCALVATGLLLFPNSDAEAAGFAERRAARDGVHSIKDVAYGNDSAQKFDVYMPHAARGFNSATTASLAPIIFMVHGGAWRMGDKDARGVVNNKVQRWVKDGFVFVSTEYRLLPHANPLEQSQDVARALAAVQARAQEWGGDGNRVILMGHSAGGHLVSLLSANRERLTPFGVRPWLATVSLDSAALDIERIMRAPHSRLYDDAFGAQPNTLWRDASPAALLSASAVPTLFVCSTTRETESCAQSRDHAAKMKTLGVRADVLEVDLNHMQINKDLGEREIYTRAVERFMASVDPIVERLLRSSR